MDFATSYAAGTAAKVTGRGIIDYAKAHTTKGHLARGFGETTIATEKLRLRKRFLSEPELRKFAERLILLYRTRKEILEKNEHAIWPWSSIGAAKEYKRQAVKIKEEVISTSDIAMLNRFSLDNQENPDVSAHVQKLVERALSLLGDEIRAAGQSAHDGEPAVDNLTPIADSFPTSMIESDNQTTPTETTFPSIIMTADSAPPDCSSIMTGESAPCSSSIITTDSITPLIPPTVPPPVVHSDRARGFTGSSARRSPKEFFKMKAVKGS